MPRIKHTATYCNTRQHTATHGNTLQNTAKHCKTLQHVLLLTFSLFIYTSNRTVCTQGVLVCVNRETCMIWQKNPIHGTVKKWKRSMRCEDEPVLTAERHELTWKVPYVWAGSRKLMCMRWRTRTRMERDLYRSYFGCYDIWNIYTSLLSIYVRLVCLHTNTNGERLI